MNERIKELAEQAEMSANKGDHVDVKQMMEKFAELIVQECVNLLEQQKEYYSKPGTYETREYYERMDAKEDAFDDAASMIRYHFGVKK
jgi:hypothetical protein